MNGAHPTAQNPNFKHLKNVSITIFITNFPTTVTSKDLWKLYDKHGVVADVYIARKLSKSGRRFGFVRFIKSPDQATLLEDLNKIWIGSYHLFAAVARFERKQNTQTKHPYKEQLNHTKSQDTSHSSQAMGARSFAAVLSGKNGSQKAVLAGIVTKSITLENSDLLELSDTSNVVLAKVRDVHLIINIHSVLKKEGFSDFKCKYMGGLWLWIEFSNDESRLKFEKNSEMEWYFTQRKPVSHNFIPDDRMIWVEIEGLPLKAWTVNAFKRIASHWGEAVFVDDDAEENIATGRVCIKTKIKTHILESCLVSIKGVNYQVRVREFANWVPNYDPSENISQQDNVSEASDNDQNIHSTNELEDEEGEINEKEDSLGHESNAPPAQTRNQDTENPLKENVPETSSKESWADVSHKAEHFTQGVDVENQVDDDKQRQSSTNSSSKPPGFEGFNIKESQKIQRVGNSSGAGLSNTSPHSARSSHIKRSDSKMCQSTGSMIDNFLRHINMGNALGYDMSGSQSDLKKFMDSIGAKHGIK